MSLLIHYSLTILLFIIAPLAYCQSGFAEDKRMYTFNASNSIDLVYLNINMDHGDCHIHPAFDTQNTIEALVENPEKDHSKIDFQKQLIGDNLLVNLGLTGHNDNTFDFFGLSKKKKPTLKITVDNKKPVNLSLVNKEGKSYVDLSDLKINNLSIKSNDADVFIDYNDYNQESQNFNKKDHQSLQEIDSIQINLDMGKVTCNQLGKSKPKYIKADVGFGTLNLDLKDYESHRFKQANVFISVGAGSANISIKDLKVPIKIITNKSFLCQVKIPNNFKKSADNTYVNTYYKDNSEEILTFNVEVSMGNIIFD